MSDFAPGDVVSICKPDECAYGFRHRDHDPYAGKVARIIAAVGPHPNWPSMRERYDLDIGLGCCGGCIRKVRPASDEFTRRMRACKPIKQPALSRARTAEVE